MSAAKCGTCQRDPKRMNSDVAECSHPDFPHRRRAWSERTTPYSERPRADNTPEAETPLDKVFSTT